MTRVKERESGIHPLGRVGWGTHLCLFYETKDDLLEILVPYFKAGLEGNEYCLWVTSDILSEVDARKALPSDVDRYLAQGQLEFLSRDECYGPAGSFDAERTLRDVLEKLQEIRAQGYEGLRITGDGSTIEEGWKEFLDYEKKVDRVIESFPIVILCSYSTRLSTTVKTLDAVRTHHPAVIRGEHGWEVVDNPGHARLKKVLACDEELIDEYREKERVLQRTSSLLDLTYESILVRDMEHRIVFWNKGAEETYGWTKEEALGRLAYELFQTGFSTPREVIEASLHERGRWEGELVHSKRDGERIVVESRQVLQRGRNGTPACILSISNDITERKLAEEALEESRARYESLYSMLRLMCDNAPDLIWAKDQDKRFLFVNKAMCEKLLYAADTDEPIGKTDMFFADRERAGHPDDWHTFGEICTDSDAVVTSAGKAGRFDEFGNVRGELLYLDVHKAPFMNEQGVMIGTVGCGREVTRERQLEQQRRLAEKERLRLGAAIDQIAEGVIVIRPEGGLIEYVNPVVCQRSGYRREELVGHSITILSDQDGAPYQEMQKALEMGKSWKGRLTQRRKDGSTYLVHAAVSPIKGSTGEITDVVVVSSDITEEVRLEEQRSQAGKMEALGTLAGGIAHDFNNMLAVIIGNAELALDDTKHDGPRENLKQILNASRRSRDLVKQVLTFSRKTEGRRKALKPARLVKETATLLRGSLPSTINMKLHIDTDSDTILADPSQIQQVLVNLASNAAHAMREDGGTLAINLFAVTFREGDPTPDNGMQPGRYVRLSVRDTGAGIPKKIRDKIFDPFFTTKEPGEGTGMGLAVVFGIVRSLEGTIVVESKVGKGSTFNVFIPASEANEEEEPRGSNSLPTGTERVLVVDDESTVADIVSNTLARLGYRVTTAKSGPEGWRKFEAAPHGIDLVITDHVMPQLTGMRLAERMLKVRKDLPIILITGYSETASLEKARSIGIAEYVMKPIDKHELARTVRRVLGSKNNS